MNAPYIINYEDVMDPLVYMKFNERIAHKSKFNEYLKVINDQNEWIASTDTFENEYHEKFRYYLEQIFSLYNIFDNLHEIDKLRNIEKLRKFENEVTKVKSELDEYLENINRSLLETTNCDLAKIILNML